MVPSAAGDRDPPLCVRIGDAFPPRRNGDAAGFEAANRTEIRFGVAIHRVKQPVSRGPFEQETVTAGWQLNRGRFRVD